MFFVVQRDHRLRRRGGVVLPMLAAAVLTLLLLLQEASSAGVRGKGTTKEGLGVGVKVFCMAKFAIANFAVPCTIFSHFLLLDWQLISISQAIWVPA